LSAVPPGREPPSKKRSPALPENASLAVAAVAALTLIGLAIRIANFDQSLFSDEISTYFVVNGPHWRS